MSWANLDLSKINPNLETIPEGTYVYTLAGGKFGKDNRVEVSARIATEGDFTGRTMYFSFPDPESINSKGKPNDWSLKAFKRLEMALGVDQQAGEDPVTYLNRAAGNRFSARVKHSAATEDYPSRAEIVLYSFSVAA